jgi:Fanconi anemia group I protein
MLYHVECSFQIDMETASGNNEAICLELLGVLRRCFMQQADVRLCLYEGKAVIMMKFNSSAATELVVFFPSLKQNVMQTHFSFKSVIF